MLSSGVTQHRIETDTQRLEKRVEKKLRKPGAGAPNPETSCGAQHDRRIKTIQNEFQSPESLVPGGYGRNQGKYQRPGAPPAIPGCSTAATDVVRPAEENSLARLGPPGLPPQEVSPGSSSVPVLRAQSCASGRTQPAGRLADPLAEPDTQSSGGALDVSRAPMVWSGDTG